MTTATDEAPYQRSTALSLFPTMVWRTELRDDVRERVERETLELLDGMSPALRELAPGRSWQSHARLHTTPELTELIAVVRRFVGSVLEVLHIGHEGFEITGCWANVNGPGAAHPIHHHPNNFLSGAYYLRVAEGADTIQFHDPRPQVRGIRPPVDALTNENTDLVAVRVQAGTLLVFPAWLEHSVPPNRSDRARVSLSFNALFARFGETMAAPMWEGGYR